MKVRQYDMRDSTYDRLSGLYEKHCGYISTNALLGEGFSNRQIAAFVQEQYLEKICHGYYWLLRTGRKKPSDHKCIEVCLSDPRAVICLDSALYYQDIIKQEPPALCVATERTDRSIIKTNFPVERHYFSESSFGVGQREIRTDYGSYRIFDVERTICDAMRLGRGLEVEIHYEDHKSRSYDRLMKYAELLRVKIPGGKVR